MGWMLYLWPTIAGAIFKWRIPAFPLGRLFLLNLLTAWTIVGWFASWIYLVYKLHQLTRGGASVPAGNPAPVAPDWQPSQERSPCGSCSGTGQVTCMPCAGQGGSWDQPQSATDVARWRSCATCVGSGKVTCSSCSGSGLR